MAKLEDILITDGDKLLSRLCSGKSCEDVAPLLEGYASVFLVYDAAVETYAGRISSLPGVRSAYAVTADEGHKDISTVMDICRWLMENGHVPSFCTAAVWSSPAATKQISAQPVTSHWPYWISPEATTVPSVFRPTVWKGLTATAARRST